MQKIEKIQYNGKLTTKKGNVYYRKGTAQDAPQIARMYEKAKIHKDNYQERLCKDGEDSFRKKGGMFIIMTAFFLGSYGGRERRGDRVLLVS